MSQPNRPSPPLCIEEVLPPLQATSVDVGMLADKEIRIDEESMRFADDATLEVFGPNPFVLRVRWQDDGMRGEAGLVFGEEQVRILSSALLMMEVPATVTEDISVAFDEVINLAVGGWNKKSDPKRAWSLALDDRTLEPMRRSALAGLCGGDSRLLVFEWSFDGKAFPVGLLGPTEWLDPRDELERWKAYDQQVLEAATPGDDDDREGDDGDGDGDAEGGRRGFGMRRGKKKSGHKRAGRSRRREDPLPAAQYMIVDVSGEITRWVLERMRNGTANFRHFQGDPDDVPEGAAVLLLDPTPDLLDAVDADATLTMDVDEADVASAA